MKESLLVKPYLTKAEFEQLNDLQDRMMNAVSIGEANLCHEQIMDLLHLASRRKDLMGKKAPKKVQIVRRPVDLQRAN